MSMHTDPYPMSPLLPRQDSPAMKALLDKASSLILQSYRQQCPAGVSGTLREALRPMNSYYTNKIEGQHTSPLLSKDVLGNFLHAFWDDYRFELKGERAVIAILAAHHRLAFPIKLFRYLFPGLWIEAKNPYTITN